MSKYIKGAITILICICIVWAVRVFTYKRVSIKTFVKPKEVARLWGEMGSYDDKAGFSPEITFESEDIRQTMDDLEKYKLSETKALPENPREGMEEIRFFFYLNEYETDVLYVTEDNAVTMDIYGYIRSYAPRDEGLFEKLKTEFFMPLQPEGAESLPPAGNN